METGFLKTKKGQQTFELADVFVPGDEIGFRAHVVNQDGLPVENAVVEISIGGPENHVL
ncbi:MAG: hypothetical protein GWO08_10375, partial [Gammaproteobacteria bacterium]|nr:hypothetical protein [Gammaproteobacteria bacterium]